ncbi:bifunctional glutamate--cysteine ligase GshA/glutathione synthetase GshB [Halosquirtibacter laminarini]|uniref:Bifunctional glutamate--cysteine ligase GshA/glutathione synthetase GshB n=1 Tax=Halosquirtibacter laminarini TaxID=3374600 RepID=A0AC61NJA5_9BACT|nr:bifunctional glutamate--cysteine ligase GshA/glutathione synthetase GshB [Prolixibacteraceae bacterium]
MMKQWLIDLEKQLPNVLIQGLFGLEKEALRVDSKGMLSLRPHPKALGDKSTHPFITTDFSESQIEIISPPLSDINEAHGFIHTLQDIVHENIGDEYLWPQSLPSLLPDSKLIPIAQYSGDHLGKQNYREYLLKTYGPELQTFSGIHFNVSLSNLIWDMETASNENVTKDQVYMKMMRNFIRYRWILIWLFGASPIADNSLKIKKVNKNKEKQIHPVCMEGVSIRSGRLGYRNHELIELDYRSWELFQKSIEENVADGKLIGPQELYLPIRIKTNLEGTEISHVEVRLLDLDPFEQTGMSIDTLRFVHLFLLYMLWVEEYDDLDVDIQKNIQDFQDWVCCHGLNSTSTLPSNDSILLIDKVKEFLSNMQLGIQKMGVNLPKDYASSMDKVMHLATSPNSRVAVKLSEKISQEGFVSFHMSQARKFKEDAISKGYRFYGLESMELSTQLLLKAAIYRGVHFDILDRSENFIRLFHQEKEEYVIQATKTRLDPYNVILMMENKTVTKMILDRFNIRVPKGMTFDNILDAKGAYNLLKGVKLVVKPQSTNFGLGITILHSSFDQESYNHALEIAFEYDHNVLVEHFIEGDEYRIFLINNKVVGALKRVPANVLGDGVHSIEQLVRLKNEDPLRGKGYRTPLEKLQIGDAEKFFLEQTGFIPSYIPSDGERVFLRENSNISTGGDSLDFTDSIHPSYFKIAEEASKAMGVAITGLDMMIEDIEAEATEDNYGIIEMNFNPAIHIHCFPFKGKNRRLNEKVLDALGF